MKTLFTSLVLLISSWCFAQEEDPFMDRDKKIKAVPIKYQLLPMDSTGRIVYRMVVNLDSSYTAIGLYSTLKEFFSSNGKNFSRGNAERNADGGNVLMGLKKANSNSVAAVYKNDQPLKLAEPDEKKLIAHVVTKYTGTSLGCVRIIYVEYDLKVQAKDGRYRYEATNFNYTHYNQATMQQIQIYGWTDSGFCMSKGTLENLLKCDYCEGQMQTFFSYLDNDVNVLLDEMKKYVLTHKADSKSEW